AGTLTWTPSYDDAPGPYTVNFTASNSLTVSGPTSISVGNQDRAPVVTAPATAKVAENAVLTLNVTAADPDGEPIGSLTAALSGLPSVHNAVFTVSADRKTGTLTWTPSYDDGRAAPYNLTFTASNALTGSSTTSITVLNRDRTPV